MALRAAAHSDGTARMCLSAGDAYGTKTGKDKKFDDSSGRLPTSRV